MSAVGSGAGGQLHADNAQLGVAVANMDSTSAEIRSLMQRVRGEVTAISGSSWIGDANVTFQNAMAKWDEAAVKMDKVLQDIHDGVHMSRVSHETQEEAAVTDLARAGQATFGISL